jgi:hypothetical protein
VKVHEPVVTGYKVMFMHFGDMAGTIMNFTQTLRDSSDGAFSAVDTYSIRARAFPASGLYSAGYRAILIYTNSSIPHALALGDSLGRFIELGGGVVEAPSSYYRIDQGSWRTRFSPFTVQPLHAGGPGIMSTVHHPAHPIMNGASSLGYTGSVCTGNMISTLRGALSTCLAEFDNRRATVACFDSAGRRAASWTAGPASCRPVRSSTTAAFLPATRCG